MELSLILTFALIIIVCVIVAIDQSRNKEPYTLGSEWDFTRTDFKPKSIDNAK
jgi:hypothetical protein